MTINQCNSDSKTISQDRVVQGLVESYALTLDAILNSQEAVEAILADKPSLHHTLTQIVQVSFGNVERKFQFDTDETKRFRKFRDCVFQSWNSSPES